MILFAVPVILKIVSKKPKLICSVFDSRFQSSTKNRMANLLDLLGRILISALFSISATIKCLVLMGR